MLNDESFDIQKAKIEELKRLFPEVVTEQGIDFDALKSSLGGGIDSAKEKYRFTWNGKSELFSLINKKTKGALKPDVKKSGGEKAFEKAENVIIEADNLEAMKLLMSAYHRRVKMIYIDPPYNKQKDFVYPDNWSDPLESYLMQTGQKDEFGLTSSYQDKTGRLHTNWLNMIYPRLYLARNLLRDDGVIFVSIDDDEAHNLRKVMDEIFGEENFVANVIWEKKYSPANDAKWFSDNHDHVLVYAKNKDIWRPNLLSRTDEANARYKNPDNDPRGVWKPSDLSVKTYSANTDYPIATPSGRVVNPPEGRCWVVSREKLEELVKDNRIWFGADGNSTPSQKRFLSEVQDGITPLTIWKYADVGHNQEARQELNALFDGASYFDTPKPVRLIRRMLEIGTNIDEDNIVLDFFAGSGTTAHAVMAQNIEDGGSRRYILVQTPEYTPENSEARKAKYKTIADITSERVRRAAKKLNYENGFRYFRLDRSHFRVFEQMQFEKGKSKEEVLKILRMSMFHDNTLMANWTPIGVAFEIGLKNGMSLTSEYKVEKNGGYTLHMLADDERVFVFCFDVVIKEDIVKLLPQNAKFVCLDKSLTDSVKLNIVAQIGLENVETI